MTDYYSNDRDVPPDFLSLFRATLPTPPPSSNVRNVFKWFMRPAKGSSFPSIRSIEQCIQFYSSNIKIRHLICSYLINTKGDNKMISLVDPTITQDAFYATQFISAKEVLSEALSFMQACRLFRDDAMTYFWTRYRFFICLNSAAFPLERQLSRSWMSGYTDRIQDISIEIDLTRVGRSQKLGCTEVNHIGKLIQELVDMFKERKTKLPVLHLLARRFVGGKVLDADKEVKPPRRRRMSRPSNPSLPDVKLIVPVPLKGPIMRSSLPPLPKLDYCLVADPFAALEGRVMAVRMTGFSVAYTERLLCKLFNRVVPKAVIYRRDGEIWRLKQPTPVEMPPIVKRKPVSGGDKVIDKEALTQQWMEDEAPCKSYCTIKTAPQVEKDMPYLNPPVATPQEAYEAYRKRASDGWAAVSAEKTHLAG